MISLVIPTYQEADVIQGTLRRAAAALARTGEEFELIVVDDSGAETGDQTASRAEALAPELPVRVARRAGRQGLATAVVDGWKAARGDVWGVMDADLQHPPEVVVRLMQALRRPGVDIALASRYVKGGGSRDWSRRRRAVSWATTHLAACVLPWTLARVRDPMSGMFLVRAQVLDGVELNPLGYKILLEVLGRGHWRDLAEVPYGFERRGQGHSKLGFRQSMEYLVHLVHLARATGQLRTWIRYATVGVSGALLDVGIFYLLVRDWGWHPIVALLAATELALLSNFAWNQTLTFRRDLASGPALTGRSVLRTLLSYQRACLAGAFFNIAVTLGFVARGVTPALAAALGVLAGGVWNLVFNVPRIWQAWSFPPSPPKDAPAGRPAVIPASPMPGKVKL
ncbi:MAG TPA: glycosyltransferase [Terriglobia bacterium]